MQPRLSLPLTTTTVLAVALFLGACQRNDAPGAASLGAGASTVRAPDQAAASTPLPVAPSGLTNSSTAAQGTDLSNTTSATGSSNTYQPPSTDNPAPDGTSSAAASGASQSVSSTTTGTRPAARP